MKEPKIKRCCDLRPHVIGDGVAPSYGTVIHCKNWVECEHHVFVPNMKGTGGTYIPAVKEWNDLVSGGSDEN